MKKGVLTVRDSEHNVDDSVGGDEAVRRTLPSLRNAWENPGTKIRLADLFSPHLKSNYFNL